MSKPSKTLFIRNLPFSTSKEKLEDIFSEFGPIKQCFTVTDRETGKSKGFGYVQFTLREDAIKAKDAVTHIDGRKVYADYADISRKKTKSEKLEDRLRRIQDSGLTRGKREREGDDEVIDSDDDDAGGDDDDQESNDDDDGSDGEGKSQENDGKKFVGNRSTEDHKDSSPKKTDLKYHRAKIVVLGGLPQDVTEEDVQKCLQKLKVKHVAEVKFSGDQIHVKFRSIREAKNGIRKLHNKTYKDCELTAIQLSEISVNIPESVLKRSRLIVRNLSFKCNEDELKKSFTHCEGMMNVTIPLKPDGKKFGFGFVQFNSLRNAMKAVELMNGKEILGRPVAVDWVLPKDKYMANQSNKSEGNQSVDSAEEMTQTTGKRKVFDDSSDEEQSGNDGDSDDDQREQSGDDESNDDSDNDSGGNDDDDDSGSDNDEKGGKKQKKSKVKQKKGQPSDVDQGKTIFIRNLSFDRQEEDLEDHFSQYGELVYCKVVVDPQTEHSKDYTSQTDYPETTNATEKNKHRWNQCETLGNKYLSGNNFYRQEAESSGIVLDGRQLIISLAVSREQSSKFNEKKEKEKRDNRNLYLARVGMIRPGTQAAEGLSKVDLDKRMKVETVKRQKLKNENIFISPYRLCVRNLPPAVDDKQLKKVFLKAAGDHSAFVTESRVMRDFKRSTGKGEGKSLGYGFVCFKEHQHALAALKHTNNNPEIFGENKRLIVEFSLENRKALETKQKRLEKQKLKQEAQKSTETSSPSKPSKPGKAAKVELLTLTDKDKKLKGDIPKGMKGLPSHWGPKIRHKARPGQQGPKKGKKGNKGKGPGREGQKGKDKAVRNDGRKRALEGGEQAPERKKRKRNMYKDTTDSFDKMVNKYKQKITGAKTSKWFD